MTATDLNRTFRLLTYDALASEAMSTLSTGVFLTGFALALGASNFAIGLLAAVPFAVQFLQFPGVILVERLRRRRAICTWSAGIGRCFLIVAALAPFVGGGSSVAILVASIAVYQAAAAVAGCAWNSWMRDLVPETEFGRFFGRRAAANTAMATALALAGGVLVDFLGRMTFAVPGTSYAGLFLVSAAIGFLGVRLLSITPDQPMPPATKHTPMLPLLIAPFRHRNFRRLMAFLASWNFAANLASPFFAVYMLKSLDYPLRTVIVLSTASQLSNIAAIGLWGSLSDRFSNKAVLRFAAPLFLLCTLAWSLTGLAWAKPITFYLLLGIHVLMGIAIAGVTLATGNIAMKLSPAGQATSFLAASGVVSASCAAVAPIVGGLCADFFATHELTLAFTWRGGLQGVTVQVLNFHAWTFFFGIAFVLGLLALHQLSFVEEAAGTSSRLMMRDIMLEARRSLRGLSSVAGLLRIARVPPWIGRPPRVKMERAGVARPNDAGDRSPSSLGS